MCEADIRLTDSKVASILNVALPGTSLCNAICAEACLAPGRLTSLLHALEKSGSHNLSAATKQDLGAVEVAIKRLIHTKPNLFILADL